jgi:hypothetical protein
MRYIPFDIWNGKIVSPSPLPAYIADITWYGKIKQIRVGWRLENLNYEDRPTFREQMLQSKELFAKRPEWRKQIKKLPKFRKDPTDDLWPNFIYFDLPTSDYYWV